MIWDAPYAPPWPSGQIDYPFTRILKRVARELGGARDGRSCYTPESYLTKSLLIERRETQLITPSPLELSVAFGGDRI